MKNKAQTELLNLLAKGQPVSLDVFHEKTGLNHITSLPNLANRLRARGAMIQKTASGSFVATNGAAILDEVDGD